MDKILPDRNMEEWRMIHHRDWDKTRQGNMYWYYIMVKISIDCKIFMQKCWLLHFIHLRPSDFSRVRYTWLGIKCKNIHKGHILYKIDYHILVIFDRVSYLLLLAATYIRVRTHIVWTLEVPPQAYTSGGLIWIILIFLERYVKKSLDVSFRFFNFCFL